MFYLSRSFYQLTAFLLSMSRVAAAVATNPTEPNIPADFPSEQDVSQFDSELKWLYSHIQNSNGKRIVLKNENDIKLFRANIKMLKLFETCGLWDNLFLSLLFELDQSKLMRLIYTFQNISGITNTRVRIHQALLQNKFLQETILN